MKVQTNNGRIVLQENWHQSGQHLPVAAPVNRMQPVQAQPQAQSLKQGSISHEAYQQIVIKLAGIMFQPMNRVVPLAQYKRVYLVEFIPHLAFDPVLPVTFVPLGKQHDDAFRHLAEWIIYWHPTDMNISHARWYGSCHGYVQTCIQAAAQVLDHDEAEYYAREMMFTHANPDRHNLGMGRQNAVTIGKIER